MASVILPPTIPTLMVGGRVFTDLANLIILYGYVSGATTTNCSLRKQGGSAGYTVTAGKTYTILAVRAYGSYTATVAGSFGYLGYSDNDVGVNSSTAYTNAKNPGNNGLLGQVGNAALGSNGLWEWLCDFQVPATKIPSFTGNGGAAINTNVVVFGYEV